ncbi:MAG: hypothetical protein K2I07_03610 [Lachnospiraceae bacterium]|nr:hypothetical protein [Lachnospiraceae bacterium]
MALTKEDLLAISEIMDMKLKTELQPLKNDMQVLKSDVEGLKSNVQVLQDNMQVLQDDMQGVKDKLHLMNLYHENVITPRLDTIESCYTGTYRRYQKDADKMEDAFDDIDLLKKVVTEHSEKLQKLA